MPPLQTMQHHHARRAAGYALFLVLATLLIIIILISGFLALLRQRIEPQILDGDINKIVNELRRRERPVRMNLFFWV